MRLGFLGGTFDPVHYGHLLMAEMAREQCRLDQIWFVPAAVPPHKQATRVTDPRQRIEMLELAIAGHEPFAVSQVETDRGGVSYTVDTLAALLGEDPSRELFWIVGADSLADLPNWRDPQRIVALATVVVCGRPGFEVEVGPLVGHMPADRIEAIRQHRVEMPLIGLSSSDIRHRVATGQSIRFQTPRAVEKYIETHGLYRDPSNAADTKLPHGPCR